MDAIITGAVALQQIRRVRRGDVAATPSELVEVPCVHEHVALAEWLDSATMRKALALVDQEPIPIRARNAKLRGHVKATRDYVTTAPFAPTSFWELSFVEHANDGSANGSAKGNGATKDGQVTQVKAESGFQVLDLLHNNHLYIDGPELCVLNAAKELLVRIKNGNTTRTIAVLKLATLIMELCGTYSRDPLNPQVSAATYHLDPITNVEKVAKFFDNYIATKGIKLVREALRWSCDGSRSTMESFTYVALVCPPRLGGVSVGKVKLNQALELNARQLALISHRTITPDFQIARYDATVEYLGRGPHEGDDARDEDRRRWKDYSTLCLRSFPMTFDDVRTPRAFNSFCRRLVQGLDGDARRREMHRLNQLFRDENFQKAQTRLFAALLPPRTCYDEYLGEKVGAREKLWGF
jgi:hypothetical protein